MHPSLTHHAIRYRLVATFQNLTEAMNALVDLQIQVAFGEDTKERIEKALDCARGACEQIHPLVDEDAVADLHGEATD